MISPGLHQSLDTIFDCERDYEKKKEFQTNSEADIQRYKNQRNHVNNMKKYAKDNYSNNIEDTISNTEWRNKTFWQIMGRFMENKVTKIGLQ